MTDRSGPIHFTRHTLSLGIQVVIRAVELCLCGSCIPNLTAKADILAKMPDRPCNLRWVSAFTRANLTVNLQYP